jgi:hypothetical protein
MRAEKRSKLLVLGSRLVRKQSEQGSVVMATYSLGDWLNLTTDKLTNLFLYGQDGTPSNYSDRVRVSDPAVVQLDADAFMTSGPGMYASASLAPFVRNFFGGQTYGLQGSYTVAQLKALGISASDFNIKVVQYAIDAGNNNYAARTYIYNSEGFTIDDNTTFVFDGDDNSHIENLKIKPSPDNFDFDSNNPLAILGNTLVLKPAIDPYGLGKTVSIQFTGLDTIHAREDWYTRANFQADVQFQSTNFNPVDSIPAANTAMQDVISQLTSDGVIKYFTDDGKPIVYGTNGTDFITAISIGGIDPSLADSIGFAGIGGPGNDTFVGTNSGCIFVGGTGDDTFIIKAASNYLDGGPDTDTLVYQGTGVFGTTGRTVVLSSGGSPPADLGLAPQVVAPFFTVDHGDGTDVIHSVEIIQLSSGNDTLKIAANTKLTGLQLIDGLGGTNTLDLSELGKGIKFVSDHIVGTSTIFKNFNVLSIDPGDTNVILKGDAAQSWKEVDFHSGTATIDSDVVNLTIDLGAGHDTVKHAGRGSVINVNDNGVATIGVSDDILVVNAKATDQIVNAGGTVEHGAIGRVGTDDAWVVGSDGMKYGLDNLGELQIKDTLGDITTVANYKGGPGVPLNQQTAGILVELGSLHAERLLDLKRPYNENIPTTFKLGNALLFTEGQPPAFNVSYDPLVLDLTGDGINLTAQSIAAPMFDTNHTGCRSHRLDRAEPRPPRRRDRRQIPDHRRAGRRLCRARAKRRQQRW